MATPGRSDSESLNFANNKEALNSDDSIIDSPKIKPTARKKSSKTLIKVIPEEEERPQLPNLDTESQNSSEICDEDCLNDQNEATTLKEQL